MKPVDFLKALGGIACIVVASSAYAQGASDAAASSPAPMSKAASSSTKKVDRQLGRKVRAAIGRAPGVDVSGIFVRARSGVVTLSGTVPDASQIDSAGTAAQGVAGVKSVSNRLTVKIPQ